jgi:hypothetical protein
MVAVKVTDWFTDDGVGDATTDVVVAVDPTVCAAVPVLPVKLVSPDAYAAVIV